MTLSFKKSAVLAIVVIFVASACGKLELTPLDLAEHGLPLVIDAPVGAGAKRDGAQVKITSKKDRFSVNVDKTSVDIREVTAKYLLEKDRTEIIESDDTSLLISRKERGKNNYYALANANVNGVAYGCETDWQAHTDDESLGRAMLAACRGLRASSSAVAGGGGISAPKSAAPAAATVELEKMSALGTSLLVPKLAKQLMMNKAGAKWSLVPKGSLMAVEIQLSPFGAKTEADVKREAQNGMLGTIERVTKTEDGRFHVVFAPRGMLQKVATFTKGHSVICDGPKSSRELLDEICGSLES